MALQLIEVTPHEIVVLKPAGLASELPRNRTADSLVRRLEAEGFTGLRLVHRLDALACGVMVIARSAQAAAHYAREIEGGRWLKYYVARAAGRAPHLTSLVGRQKAYLRTLGRRATVVRSGGKAAFLDIDLVVDEPDSDSSSLVLLQLITGRYHQIRAMLAHLGAPLTGDAVYGGPVGRPFYLEHVLLGARPFDALQPRLWMAPAHADRASWPAALLTAVAARAHRLSLRSLE